MALVVSQHDKAVRSAITQAIGTRQAYEAFVRLPYQLSKIALYGLPSFIKRRQTRRRMQVGTTLRRVGVKLNNTGERRGWTAPIRARCYVSGG